MGVQRRPAAPRPRDGPRRPAPAVVARLPLPLLLLPLTPAVDALSRGEGYGVLAVPLLAATLKLTSQLNRGDNVADTVTVSSLTHKPSVTFTEHRCVLSTKSISAATFFSWSNRAGLRVAAQRSLIPSSTTVGGDLNVRRPTYLSITETVSILDPPFTYGGGRYSIKSFLLWLIR